MFFITQKAKIILIIFFILTYTSNYIQSYAQEDVNNVIDNIKKEHKIVSLKNFTLINLKGERVNIRDLQREKYKLIINFWALWCAPCIKELPHLSRLSKIIKEHDFKFIYINQDSKKDFKRIIKFLEEKKIDKNMVFVDPTMRMTREFKLRGIPTTFIVDENSEIDWRIEGVINSNNTKFLDWLKEKYK